MAAAAALAVLTAGVAWLAVRGRSVSHPRAVAGNRLRVALEPVQAGSPSPPRDLLATLDAELVRAVAAHKALQAVEAGSSDVRVRVVVEGGAGRVNVRFTILDSESGSVLAFQQVSVGRVGGSGELAESAAAIAAALELEQVCRELEESDPLHGFLVRRTKVLEAARAFRDGLQLAARTRLPEAKRTFRRALEADPSFWPAHLYLGMNAKATGHFDEWAAELDAARRLVPHPDETEAVVIEEVAAMLTEDSQRRLEALERARALFPESGELTYRAAQAYRIQDRPAEAIPLFEKLLRSGWRPDWSPTREELALSQLLAGKLDEVLRTTSEGEERFPTRYKYPLYAALALQQRGEQAKAREALQRAIRKHLDFSSTSSLVIHQTAQYWASLLRWEEERQRQWQAVLVEAERELRDKPTDADLAVARAEALAGLGRFANARTVLNEVGVSQSHDPDALRVLARACGGLGETACARAALDRAGDLWRAGGIPALGTLAYNIAAGWAALGDTRQAYEWLLRARDQYGADRLDLTMDPDLDSLRRAGLLEKLPPRR